MIYTKARLTAEYNICEGGTERTEKALERLGLTMDSRVSMQLIMRELGLSDTLFSFCAVCKGCEDEANKVLWTYMMEVVGRAGRWLTMVGTPDIVKFVAEANGAINKRCSGRPRPALQKKLHDDAKALHDLCPFPQDKFWLFCYMCMLSDRPDHLAATHATIALLDGCEAVGMRQEAHDTLFKVMMDLLGPEPH